MRAELGTALVALSVALVPTGARAASPQVPCPRAEHLPLLTIDDVKDPAVPLIDEWQVTFLGVPLSDAQIAGLARDDTAIERTRAEIRKRGSWVYIGIATAALGTALSSLGWVLYGQDGTAIPRALALSMGIGGIGIGGAGTLLTVEAVQKPLEPHIAPTPEHRLTRTQIRQLVTTTNTRLYDGICTAVKRADEDRRARAERLEALRRGEANPKQIFLPVEPAAANDSEAASSEPEPQR